MSDDDATILRLELPPDLAPDLVELALHINKVLTEHLKVPVKFAMVYAHDRPGGGAQMSRLSNCVPEEASGLFQLAAAVEYTNPAMVERQ